MSDDDSAMRSPRRDDEADDPETAAGPGDADADPATLAARVQTLEAENERLRESVAAAQRRRYRYTALGLAVVGVAALVGAALLPGVRTVLLALGGTGLFGAILTFFLTPERFVAASVGERIYATLADNEAAIVDDLELAGDPVVVPTTGSAAPARLFVPRHPDDGPPDEQSLHAPFVTDETDGLAVEPTGAGLYDSLADATGTLPDTPDGIARAVGDALVEQFELVDAVETDAKVRSGEGAATDADGAAGGDGDTDRVTRVTLAVDGSAYGPVDRFDHPVASLLATTLAVELDGAATVTVDEADRADWLVTCRVDV